LLALSVTTDAASPKASGSVSINGKTAAMQVQEITVSKGWVHGKLEWKGTLPNPFEEKEVLTAFSATFELPLEELQAP
jgi:hypothetical protein